MDKRIRAIRMKRPDPRRPGMSPTTAGLQHAGGFLRRGNVTLLIGVEDERVQDVLELVKGACGEPDAGQHRATVFVLKAEQFEQV